MYEKFYRLKENPFNVTSDPVFFFSSSNHTDALSHLTYGIEQRKGILLITGEVGTGKTTLCRTLLHRYKSRLKNNIKTALILNPSFSDRQLLQLILKDFGIQGNFKNKFDLINALNEFLLEETGNGHNIVLIIDEAQNLGAEQLEQIRLLSNLETEKEKLLQIILVGQPELCEKLELSSLRQLNQRIAVRYHLLPLKRDEIKKYIRHRLKVASSKNSKNNVRFTDKAIDAIYKDCKGTPRMINILCDRALLAGFALETLTIDKNIIQKCIKEVAIKSNQLIPGSTKKKRSWYKNIYVLLCILCAIGSLSYMVLDLYGQPFISLKSSVQKFLSVRLNLSNLSSLSIKEKAVLPKPDQPGLVGEDKENMNELYTSGYNFDRQKNYKEAVRWYRKSAEQGHAQAQVNLGTLYSKGLGVGRDYTEAVKWYRKAAEQEHAQAQNNLGVMYSEGQGVEQDYNEAAKWCGKAAEQGHAQAQTNLCIMYSEGQGVEQDYKEAAKLCRKAAEQGHGQAQAILGIMYSQGQGVEQDFIEAARWHRKAAEQGINYAREALKRLEQNYPDDNNFLIDLQKPID
ncbi:MAG: AAA family ATPase [Candidatus Scalindua sp.]